MMRVATESGQAPPYDESTFLTAQDKSWKDLKRCRERSECFDKLVRLGILKPGGE